MLSYLGTLLFPNGAQSEWSVTLHSWQGWKGNSIYQMIQLVDYVGK